MDTGLSANWNLGLLPSTLRPTGAVKWMGARLGEKESDQKDMLKNQCKTTQKPIGHTHTVSRQQCGAAFCPPTSSTVESAGTLNIGLLLFDYSSGMLRYPGVLPPRPAQDMKAYPAGAANS